MESSFCPAAVTAECEPHGCHWRCAPDVIDELLSQPGPAVQENLDRWLDLRWHLQLRQDAETALCLFCDLRRILESTHYLTFFRIRRWLENHLVARVSP